jgi:GT2 family glycosyltransferase
MIAVKNKEGTKNLTKDAVPESASMGPYASQPKIEHVAVVIPARNRPDLLEKCLESLACQIFPEGPLEILVCDDGSSEDLATLVRTFDSKLPNIRLIKQEPKGPAAARNMGFRSSHADIFVCVDSDVICADGFLQKLVEALRRKPDWVAAEATVLPAGEMGPFFDAPVNHGGTYGTGASAYRASALVEVGGLDEMFPYPACEDAELAARLLRLGTYGYVPEAIVYHPTRRVSLGMRWRTRKYWRYVMILAKRYRFLAFPGKPVGPFPRLRVSVAAIITLPAGRLLESLAWLKRDPAVGAHAFLYGLFDVLCGLRALPEILFSSVPERKNYLAREDMNAEHKPAVEDESGILAACGTTK